MECKECGKEMKAGEFMYATVLCEVIQDEDYIGFEPLDDYENKLCGDCYRKQF